MLAAALAIVTAYAGTFSVSDRTEVRARTTVQSSAPALGGGSTPATLSLDLLNQPIASLLVTDRRWDYTLNYSPSFILPDVQLELAPQIINVATTGITWHTRTVRLSLTEDATYAYENTGLLLQPGANGGAATTTGTTTTTPTGQITPLQPLASPSAITIGSSRTTLASSLRLGRRTTLYMDVGYLVSGGVDAYSRSILPEQYGPRADASVEYTATRRDALITSASASHVDFTNGTCVPAPGAAPLPMGEALPTCAPQATIVQAAETWRRALSRSSALSLGAGASVVRARAKRDDRWGTTPYPTATANFAQRFDERALGQLDLTAELAPAIDVRTGLLSQRIQGQVAARWHVSPKVTLRVIGGAARSISKNDPLAFTLVRGEVEADYRLSRVVDLSIGERTAWQSQDQFGRFFSTMGYFAVTVHAPALRF